ncbi:glyoxalase [Marinicauda salina]|uniref:Glyoxalase n=1 Tax=Marinicauda salina TaxID=2135793 RepID=A0A2U2BU36_9PROT|nr:VOC family protein [Marinicauda salina]PWE17509.1 glyoxalase [Marinicauda salina]
MAKVIGIGGVFARCDDAEATGRWYADVLGIELADFGGAHFRPQDFVARHGDAAMTVWCPFGPAMREYMEPGTAAFMINLVVDDLDGVLERARSKGVEPVTDEPVAYDNGRFAWIVDPDGVKVELWEPAGA